MRRIPGSRQAATPAAWQRLFDASAAQEFQLAGLNLEVYADPKDPADQAGADLYAWLA